MPAEIDYLGEGRSDETIARRLIQATGHIPGVSYLRPLKGTGKASLDGRLMGLNRGVAFGRPVLVLRDLDGDSACPSVLIARLLPNRHPRLLLRVAVRAAESWLLADRDAYARYCGLRGRDLPTKPEEVDNLKGLLLIAATARASGALARHIAACRVRGLADWQTFGEWHATFAGERWNPDRAAASGAAPSLSRALASLRRLVP